MRASEQAGAIAIPFHFSSEGLDSCLGFRFDTRSRGLRALQDFWFWCGISSGGLLVVGRSFDCFWIRFASKRAPNPAPTRRRCRGRSYRLLALAKPEKDRDAVGFEGAGV